MIIRARIVVPMSGVPIDDGAVAVEGNTITGVGRFADLRRGTAAPVLDLGEQALLPGLINAHCHLDYTVLRGKIPPQKSFADWIRAINAEKTPLTERDYTNSIKEGFAEARRFGTTAIANLTALPKLVATIKAPVRTWWFGELIDVRNPEEAETIADDAARSLRSASEWGLAPHAPYTASERLYARCEEIARRKNRLLTTHLAESEEEAAMFGRKSGPMFEFLKSIGRPVDDCGQETPVSLFLRTRAMDLPWIVAHLNELNSSDFDLLAARPKFHIAHCPRSHAFFGHRPFAIERLRALGFNICLGTDSLASNADLSLFAEMRALLGKHDHLTPGDVLEMATINGAAALGQRNRLGCIRAGAYADMIALPVSGPDVCQSIVAFEGEVPWTMQNGQIGENADNRAH
ncbi:MAG: amidohydrolase family protein [Chthoniobacterales bacterium]